MPSSSGLEQQQGETAAPEFDYDKTYRLPRHWGLDPNGRVGVDYFDYVAHALGLLRGEGLRVLDAGCGDGYVTGQLQELGHSAVGIDSAGSAIGFARLLVPEAQFVEADLRTLDSSLPAEEGFDAIFFVEVFEHIPPVAQLTVLRNLRAQLDCGGQLIMTVPSLALPLGRWHYKHFSLDELRELLAEAGFAIDEVVYQHRRGWLTNLLFTTGKHWRWLDNRYYDAKALRNLACAWYRRSYSTAPGESTACRIIVRAIATH